jgi:hypothetical protein
MAFVEKPRRDSNKSPLAGKNNTPSFITGKPQPVCREG